MKNKKIKILAFGIVLMLVSISLGMVQAVELKNNDEKTGLVTIEISPIYGEENSIIETVVLSEDQLNELELILSDIIMSIESANSWEDINIILDDYTTSYLHKTGIIYDLIIKIITGIMKFIKEIILNLKILFDSNLVISSGHCFRFNLFKTRRLFKIRKNLCVWHYFKGKTLIWKPDVRKTLIDRQIGFMSFFNGMYLHISKKFPQRSYTFFFGMPKIVDGISL
jgi:hypothetical protein